ncbi:hypothetical protein Q1695_007023 [Nippostrongylus brasiliensis]|nr:hypothetical protein Q1695_007023 [Nippostrongylus brasiliensis]
MRRPKKHKASSESPPPDLESAVHLLINDATLPAHLRVVIGHLLEIKKDYSNVLARNQELLDEVKDAHQKNKELQQENEAPHDMTSRGSKGHDKEQNRVAFSSKPHKEYTIPENDASMNFESLISLPQNDNHGFLDEIALLKKGIITKDTPRHTYRRSAEHVVEHVNDLISEDRPITLAELNSRGLRLNKDQVIYSIPEGTVEAIARNNARLNLRLSDSERNTNRSVSSSTVSRPTTTATRRRTEDSDLKQYSKEFYVGYPGENAKLKISQLKDGYSYKLNIMDDVCLLQKTSKASRLLQSRKNDHFSAFLPLWKSVQPS